MIIYFDRNFNEVDKAKAIMAKVIEKDKPPRFIAIKKKGQKK